MKYFYYMILFAVGIYSSCILSFSDPHFVILIASYNNKRWYRNNLASVFAQDYPYYRVIYVDDNSSDGTADIVEDYLRYKSFSGDFTLIRNTCRHYKVANFYRTIHELCDDDEIIVELDGDDYLFDASVLSKLAKYYQDPAIWMTYGQYIEESTFRRYQLGKIDEVRSSKARPIPQKVVDANSFRQYPWVTMHLRTFRAWLFKAIRLEDLLEENDFLRVAGDLGMSFPMLEMAGNHSFFVSQVLYVYNNHSPLNDFRTNPIQQIYTEYMIRHKKPYQPLAAPVKYHERDYKHAVDLILVSRDPAANLKEVLENIRVCIPDIAHITIIYPNEYNASTYQHQGRYVLRPVNMEEVGCIKNAILTFLQDMQRQVILMNDTVRLSHPISTHRVVQELERTQAHAVLLHMTKDQIDNTQMISIFDDVYAWDLKNHVRDDYFSSPYMILYRQQDLYEAIKRSETIDGAASRGICEHHIGLIIDVAQDDLSHKVKN